MIKRTWQKRLESYVDEDVYRAAVTAAHRAETTLSQWVKRLILRELAEDSKRKEKP